MSNASYVVSRNGNMTILYNRKSHQVASDHPNYVKIKKALLNKNFRNFDKLLDTGTALKKLSKGVCTVKYGEVYFNDKPLHNVVTERILGLMREGFPFEPMLRFLENLMTNPSERAIKELYDFLANRGLPITEDGCFLAYKSVKSDYYDKYSGRFLNKPGAVLEMPRKDVDEDANQTCSVGFHVGALDYSGPGGWYNSSNDKVIVVKVNPRDAVSVPADHNAQKLRVCRYEVLYDYAGVLEASVYSQTGKVAEYDNTVDYSEEDDLTPYEEGYKSYPVDDCPYDEGTDSAEEWYDGYYDAESDEDAGEDEDEVEEEEVSYKPKRDKYGRFCS
jgi:hypothetical protein